MALQPKEIRQMALNQIRNTLIKIARIDDTCDLKKLIIEICRIYQISERTAQSYINELINLGIARIDYKMGWIWHAHEDEFRQVNIDDYIKVSGIIKNEKT